MLMTLKKKIGGYSGWKQLLTFNDNQDVHNLEDLTQQKC